MPDEPIMIRGGSLTIDCGDHNTLNQQSKGKYQHSKDKGKITSVEVFDGNDGHTTVDIKNASDLTKIIIHYDV